MDNCIGKYIREPHFEKGKWIEGRELRIYLDDDPINPRDGDWQDNFGHMVCFHRDYILGDKHNLKQSEFSSWDDVEEYLIKEEDAVIILPLYLYDHSGITIQTSPFSDRWDSMQVGFIYCSNNDIKECFLKKDSDEITSKILKQAENNLLCEVKEYDEYLRGEVYGFILYEDNEEVDSCWGFYGGIDRILEETGMRENEEVFC